MYMYYLLGHRLWDKALPRKVKEQVSYNTYLLTLDGDVHFKPNAVHLLVDLMRRNLGVGAACGRIHPAGNGKSDTICKERFVWKKSWFTCCSSKATIIRLCF